MTSYEVVMTSREMRPWMKLCGLLGISSFSLENSLMSKASFHVHSLHGTKPAKTKSSCTPLFTYVKMPLSVLDFHSI